MAARYDIRHDLYEGWSVVDTRTEQPVRVNDTVQTRKTLEDADDLADLLNKLDREKPSRLS